MIKEANVQLLKDTPNADRDMEFCSKFATNQLGYDVEFVEGGIVVGDTELEEYFLDIPDKYKPHDEDRRFMCYDMSYEGDDKPEDEELTIYMFVDEECDNELYGLVVIRVDGDGETSAVVTEFYDYI